MGAREGPSRRMPTRGGGVTFAGLLNALDGVAAQEGKLLFLTTNHIDKLDAALIRPGRVDYRARLGLASKPAARQLFARFYRGGTHEADGSLEAIADGVAQRVPEDALSMAAIQGHLMKFADAPVEALSKIDELVNPPLD